MDALDALVLAAHPDDAELGCAGTLLKMTAEGKAAGVIDLTRGELGTRGTPALRAQEAAAAADILGLAVRDNLGLRDGFFANDEAARLADRQSLARVAAPRRSDQRARRPAPRPRARRPPRNGRLFPERAAPRRNAGRGRRLAGTLAPAADLLFHSGPVPAAQLRGGRLGLFRAENRGDKGLSHSVSRP